MLDEDTGFTDEITNDNKRKGKKNDN